MVYSIVGVAVSILAAGALVVVRRMTVRARSDSLDIAAAIGGLVLLVSLVVAAAPPFHAALEAMRNVLPSVGWQRGAIVGALGGVVVYLITRVLFVDVLVSLVLWVTRREDEDQQPIAVVAKNHLIHAAVAASLFAGFFSLFGMDITWLPLLAIPFFIAALPVYEGQVRPWIEFRKARDVEDGELQEVRAWLRETCGDRRTPRFKVRIRETSLNNALATGGAFGYLVVIGGGLLKNLEPRELKAVLAHEIAHVVNRDTLWLTLMSLAGSAGFITWITFVSGPLMGEGGARMVAGVALLAVGGAISFLPLQAIFSPRLEYRADRVAATMLGDARPLARALARIAELTETPMGLRTLTHPSFKARIDALAQLQEHLH